MFLVFCELSPDHHHPFFIGRSCIFECVVAKLKHNCYLPRLSSYCATRWQQTILSFRALRQYDALRHQSCLHFPNFPCEPSGLSWSRRWNFHLFLHSRRSHSSSPYLSQQSDFLSSHSSGITHSLIRNRLAHRSLLARSYFLPR